MRTLFLILWVTFLSVAAQAQNWYKKYTGTIGPYPVTLHLHKAGHAFSGYYYYEKVQQPLAVMGTDTTLPDSIELLVTGSAAPEERFRLVLRGNSAAGTWYTGDKKASLPFAAKETSPVLPFQYVSISKERLLRPGMNASPAAAFSAAVVWPRNANKAAASIRRSVYSFLGSTRFDEAPLALLQNAAARCFKAYAATHAAATETEIKEMPPVFMRDQTLKVTVAYEGKMFVSLAFFSYAYSGGAHGNYGTAYETYNLQTGTKLLLHHVLTPEGLKKLPRLLATAFRKQKGLSPAASLKENGLFVDDIEPNKNFFVTGKSIGFNFTPYEIGPYAMGEIVLYISFNDMPQLLQPRFAALLKKN